MMGRQLLVLSKLATLLAAMSVVSVLHARDWDRFLGTYTGSAEVQTSTGSVHRDLSVVISRTKKGYEVNWKSATYKEDGRVKVKEYTIGFLPTAREGIFASTMGTNVFGNPVPLDPMKGDPYVWGRIAGDTMTVFALHINEEGGYELQEYHRTLSDGGLNLDYLRIRNGEKLKSVSTFLKKVE